MKKLRLLLSFLILFISQPFNAQNLLTKASSSAIDEALDVETDNAGNSYLTGFVGGQSNFGGLTTNAYGGQDIFVAKMNNAGNFLWVKTFGGSGAERGLDLDIDNNGNVYITGYFFGTANFGTISLSSTSGSRDLFVAKLNGTNGNVVWANKVGGTDAETGHSVTCDNLGNVIVAGQFEGSLTLGSNTYTTPTNTSTGSPASAILLIKYNSSGALVWSKAGISNFNNKAVAVDHDASNNLYITGNFSDNLTIDGVTISNQQLNAGYTAKFSAAGTLDWFRKIVGNPISPIDLKINGSDLLVTGDFQGDLIYYGASSNETLTTYYSNNFFLLKTSTAGNYVWGETIGSNNPLSVRALALSGNSESYLTGTFECNLEEIRPNYGTALWTSIGGNDIFVMKFNAAGTQQWDRHQGGLDDDMTHGISLNGTNNPVVCGSFKNNFYMAFGGVTGFPTYINNADKLTLNGCGVNTGLGTGGNLDILIFEPYEGTTQPPYNYYQDNTGACLDSVAVAFDPDVDSLIGCNGFSTNYTSAYMTNGPSVSVTLNNSVPGLPPYSLSSTQTYYLEEFRLDGCGSSIDSLYVEILPSPPTLWLTDDEGINVQNDPYLDVYLCDPDTIDIQLETVPPNMDVSIIYGGSVISDTNWANDLYQDGQYQILLENEYGCISNSTFNFYLEDIDYDTISPYLKLIGAVNDSIAFCEGEYINIYALDAITNPTGNNIFWDGEYMEISWNGAPYDSISAGVDFVNSFLIDSTGWHDFSFSIVIGYDNTCGTYLDTLTVIDSFYIDVLEVPSINFDVDSLVFICPGGTGVIVADTSLPNFVWSGPGIVSTSADNTTIVVDEPGGYVFQGILTHPTSGCSTNVFLAEFINYKPIPSVTSSSSPAVICPGDSILISVPDIPSNISYNWIGPNGNSVGNSSSIYVFDQGDYYCIIMDEDSCQITTDDFSVNEYTTPNIDISGSLVLCGNDSLELEVEYYGNPIFYWDPTGDTTASIFVSDSGYYYCTIELCGITTTDSVYIQDMSLALDLNVGDTLFCIGDSIYVETSPGLATYTWSPNGENTNGIWVSSPGDYSVTATSTDGCVASTDTVSIGYFFGNENMDFPDTTLCIGDSAAFTYTGNGSIEWFINNNLVSTQNTYVIQTLTDPFTLVYTIDRPYCGPYTDSFTVALSNLPSDITFLMDEFYCHNDSLILATQDPADNYEWTNSNNENYTGNNVVIYPIDENNSGMYYLTASNQYCSTEDSMYITVFPSFTLQLNTDTSFICKNSTDEVYDTLNSYNSLYWEFENSFFTDDETLYVDQSFEDGYYVLQGLDVNNCPFIPDSVQVYNTNNHNFFIQLDTAACIHTQLNLYADEIPNTNFIWTLPDGSNQYTSTVSINDLDSVNIGWYNVEIEVFGNCNFSDSLYLDLYLPFEFSLGNDTLICRKEFYGIYPPDGLNTLYWENGSNEVPHYVFNDFNSIILTNIDENGCYFSDTLELELSSCTPVVPNVITVNGDGMNDYFIIKNSEKHPRNRLEIVNRWGNPIYEKDHYDNTFNGVGLSDGTYFFIYYEDTDDKEAKPYTGFLTIISE
ncbi:gliding motility-associated C-terminal domain-containing protein [Lishizhenia tianjinensis]|uniref:Gliding motility-associated C-terminal domain-containing protein n=1 Tax=Lishizhenia tianjinensis TaxID=477690 RepID=A0A1I7BKQ6_9FLAO|nr:gliding motility-associated C-terminal domain-containing protein [Lishizhenia tianjinensis]SFT87745.1 gliding motility-associated C-terminal domain-containing protein [Lishizhenia tianjinensis]